MRHSRGTSMDTASPHCVGRSNCIRRSCCCVQQLVPALSGAGIIYTYLVPSAAGRSLAPLVSSSASILRAPFWFLWLAGAPTRSSHFTGEKQGEGIGDHHTRPASCPQLPKGVVCSSLVWPRISYRGPIRKLKTMATAHFPSHGPHPIHLAAG